MTVPRHHLLWSFGLAKATTRTSDAERACLARHAAGRAWLAEVGVWHGVTTGSVRVSREVVLVDPRFEPVEAVDTLTVVRRRG